MFSVNYIYSNIIINNHNFECEEIDFIQAMNIVNVIYYK